MVEKTKSETYSTAQVASLSGIHKDTLLRWLRQGLIAEPCRDRRGWRIFTGEQAAQVVKFANQQGESGKCDLGDPNVQSLLRLDWDFADAKTSYLTHSIHPYPAKYIPQIPNAVIQELSSVGDTVADIFCGSGTTLVEALLLKRHAVGVDANPLAALISKVKTTRLSPDDVNELRILVAKAEAYACQASPPKNQPLLFPPSFFKSNASRPESDAISFWFEDFIVEELAQLRAWCRELTSEDSRSVALCALSSIIIVVSKQDSDTRYVRTEKHTSPGDAFRRFARSLENATNVCSELYDAVEPRFSCRIHNSSVLDAPDIGGVDLVVCSPPYPNAYSYHLYHMTRMLWLEMDQPRFKKVEIGSHRKYSRKGESRATSETFRSEMLEVFRWLSTHLKRSGYACFVVGNSILDGQLIDNASILVECGSENGFREVGNISRVIKKTSKAFNPAYGKIKTENVLVFRYQ